jgi:hypothetical protein
VSKFPLELIYFVVWGSASESVGRKSYYVCFIDDFSNLHGFICLDSNLTFFRNSKNSRLLLNTNLVVRFLRLKWTGEENIKSFILSFFNSTFHTMCLTPTHINKMALQKGNIPTSWKLVYPSLLMHPWHLNSGMRHF